MRRHASLPRAGQLAVLGVVLLVALRPSPAAAQTSYEAFDAEVEVHSDGTFTVTETLDVVFPAPRHGIFRELPEKYVFDDRHLRATGIDVLGVRRDGDAEEFEVEHTGPQDANVRIRIGDPGVEIDGGHQYVIRYVVDGAFNTFSSHEELYWNVAGNPGETAYASARVTVTGPDIVRWACFSGPTYQTQPCAEEYAGRDGVRYLASSVGAGNNMTVVVGFRRGSIEVDAPRLEEIWTAATAFSPTGPNIGLAAVLAVALIGFLVIRLRRGRDERGRGAIHEPGSPDLLPVAEDVDPDDAPVQFRPPGTLKPAHLGLLDDERVDPVDIGATVVDLAVRGHILIQDRNPTGAGDPDWVLAMRVGANPGDTLAPFEQRLVDGLQKQAAGGEVRIADLRGEFHSDFTAVADMLYEESLSRGWFKRNPDSVRKRYRLLALASLAAAAGLGFLASAVRWKVGLAVVPIGLFGLVLLVLAGRMPAKTASGRAVFLHTRGFKKFIETAEKPEMNYAVQQGEFLKFLPFAVAFGAVEAWARATRGLDIAAATAGWYVGPMYTNWGAFGSGFSSFSSSVGSGLASAPAASGDSGFSGGFSGGGFGGGSVGDW